MADNQLKPFITPLEFFGEIDHKVKKKDGSIWEQRRYNDPKNLTCYTYYMRNIETDEIEELLNPEEWELTNE